MKKGNDIEMFEHFQKSSEFQLKKSREKVNKGLGKGNISLWFIHSFFSCNGMLLRRFYQL